MSHSCYWIYQELLSPWQQPSLGELMSSPGSYYRPVCEPVSAAVSQRWRCHGWTQINFADATPSAAECSGIGFVSVKGLLHTNARIAARRTFSCLKRKKKLKTNSARLLSAFLFRFGALLVIRSLLRWDLNLEALLSVLKQSPGTKSARVAELLSTDLREYALFLLIHSLLAAPIFRSIRNMSPPPAGSSTPRRGFSARLHENVWRVLMNTVWPAKSQHVLTLQ